MTIYTTLRKLSLKAMKWLGLYTMAVMVFVCYFEFGHDKGWPEADLMYMRFHGLVISVTHTFAL